MATKGSALRQRIVAASRALLPALDRTDPMQLSASVARVKSSPFFEVAQRDPVFQKAYAEAEKAAFDFQAKAAAEKQKSDLKIAEDTAASKNKIAETQAKGESDKKEAPQYLVEKSTKVAQSSNDLDDLAAQFKNQSTGPVVGFLRELNPYDTSAQTFRAKLFATVPNLARGVFNEVGVLTDSDVQNYLRTLPNLKTPQDRGEALIAQLRQVLERQRSNLKSVIEGQGYKTGGLTGLLAPATAQPALIRTPEDLAKAKAEKLARQGSR
jgi:tellurite resistance protein